MVGISLIVPISPASDRRDVELLLRSISSQTYGNVEVLVVPEGDCGQGVRMFPSVRVLSPPHKRGASAARNHGARYSNAEILGFLDDDVVLDSRWCEYAVASFRDSAVGGVSGQAKVPLELYGLDYVPRELMWAVGGTYWGNDGVQVVPSMAGMNLCIRRTVFTKAGGYNEFIGPSGDRPETKSWLRIGAEEDDLSQKVQVLCGKRIVFDPRMVVTHRLRRETVTPKGLVKRCLHVGHNRAYIHSKYPASGDTGDNLVLRRLVGTTLLTLSSFPRHPLLAWKRLSFTSVVIASLGLGYLVGLFGVGLDPYRTGRGIDQIAE